MISATLAPKRKASYVPTEEKDHCLHYMLLPASRTVVDLMAFLRKVEALQLVDLPTNQKLF